MRHILTGRALADSALTGPKLARQARMREAGLPVPAFFALSARACEEALAPHLPRLRRRLAEIDFDDPAAIAAAAAAARELITTAAADPALDAALLAAFDTAFAPDAAVAVRSSTVGADAADSEDSADNPFAGMSDSYLYVRREEVPDRVRLCWASGYNAESLLYRHAQGLELTGFSVAVAVQEMVPGRRSFVLFTCDPATGARRPVVAAAHGIGEGVVQERVPVDHFFLDPATATLTRRLAHKDQRVDRDPHAPSGTALLPVPEAERDVPVLDDAELWRIALLGERIEALFAGPLDIEGTLTADGRVHILQSRPVVLDLRRQRLWSSANITESFPGTTTALTYSHAQLFYRTIFHDLYRDLGVDERTLHGNRHHLASMIGFVHHRVHYSLTAWYHLHRQVPLFALGRARWEQMMGLTTTPDSGRDSLRGGTLAHRWRMARSAARVGRLLLTHGRRVRAYEQWWDALVPALRDTDWHAADPLDTVERTHRLWREVGDHWGVTLVNDLFLTMGTGAAERLLDRWVGEPGLLGDLLCGGEENRSVAAVMSLLRLAETAREAPGLLAAVAGRPAEEVWEQVRQGEFGAEFTAAADAHLRRYGDRGLQELKLEQPTPRVRPWLLLPLVAEHARGGRTAEELRRTEDGIRARGEERLAAALRRRPVRRAVVRALLERVRRLIRHREDSRYRRSELFGVSRAVHLALGAWLVERKALDAPGDVFHLTHEEVLGSVDGTGVATDLRAVAEARRRAHEQAGPELPLNFATMGPVPASLPAPAAGGSGGSGEAGGTAGEAGGPLAGLGSSGGTVRGTARVVLDPHGPVPAGDDVILVARETDPGWLFLMLRARGIVVERGTMLSHTAITGRTFGIPTIVALPGATSRIPDGCRVEMDGATGTVTLLDDGEAGA
ncbi:PEP/pyruvate-binding domain-containing protein [Streptomyces bohaiensis]|uniref:PEP/pyruvate-binding domain-containing protein n=1 Tax=Streptomyces bohaiensis TaxID=1431344 RepID=UPI003B7B4DB5